MQASMTGYRPFLGTLSLKAGEQKEFGRPYDGRGRGASPTTAATCPATISTFKVVPDTIQPGEQTKLIWETQHATSVSISPEIGKVAASGERTLNPERTKDYTLIATGAGGSPDARSVTITVKAEPKPPPPPPPGGPSDAEGITKAREAWKQVYERNNPNAKFVQDSCPSPQIIGDSAGLTCQDKIALVVNGNRITMSTSITYHFGKRDGKWEVEGQPVFNKK